MASPDFETPDDEVTQPLTGKDAPVSEADAGSAGSGASPWGADATETSSEELEDRIEPDPGAASDIRPDRATHQ